MKKPVEKLKTYYIFLGKPRGLFLINLGPVKAANKKEAKRLGDKLCDDIGRPQWKSKISAREK